MRLLRIGSGRAVLYLQEHPAAPYCDAILHACLHNLAYDPQCEGNRATYMLDVINATGERPFYRTQIMQSLADSPEGWDGYQRYAFMGLFAAEGDAEARQALYDHVHEALPQDDWSGVDQVIDLDGLAGFCVIARLLGERALTDPEFDDDERLLQMMHERFGEEAVHAALDQADPGIAAYVRIIASSDARRAQAAALRATDVPSSYEEVKLMVGNRGRIPTSVRRWMRATSDEEVQHVADDLRASQDRDTQLGLLRLFRWRPFPGDPAPVLALALSDDDDVRNAAIRALEDVHHPAVRDVALRFFAASERLDDAVALLRSNSEPGDQALILRALSLPLTDDEVHAIGLSVLDIVQSYEQPDDVPMLLRLYERGPCSTCRHWFVKCLDAVGAVPDWMWAECCFDARDQLRELARSRHEQGIAASGDGFEHVPLGNVSPPR